MNIAILDGIVIAVVLISAVLAMFRGFVREVLSIAAWVAAAILAYAFYEELLPYVSEYVQNPTVAAVLSAAAIFLVALIVVSLITMKISDFVMDSPVGPIDRLAGFLFGVARGLLLAVVALLFFNWLVDAPNRPAWVTTAATYPQLSEFGNRLLDVIPDNSEEAIRGAFGNEGAGTGAAPAASSTATPGAGDPAYRERQRQELDQAIDAAQDDRLVVPAAPTTPTTPAAPAAPAAGDGPPAPAGAVPAADGDQTGAPN